jgi:hypothetical protein
MAGLQGDWAVQNSIVLNILFILNQDTVCFHYSGPDAIYEYYSINDMLFARFLILKNLQNWTITENNNDLFLETQDFVVIPIIMIFTLTTYNIMRKQSCGELLQFLHIMATMKLVTRIPDNYGYYSE